MRPKSFTDSTYVAAFRELALRLASSLKNSSRGALPVRMFVAGGAALHFYTGTRISVDVDAVFSRRIALPPNLDVSYKEKSGAARLLYFDRQYNDTFGLLHEDAYQDSVPLSLRGVDASVLDIRLLAPVDLAISKLGRFAEQDRSDILELGKKKLIAPAALRSRAEEALGGYVGDVGRLQGAIDYACRMLEKHVAQKQKRQRKKSTRRGSVRG